MNSIKKDIQQYQSKFKHQFDMESKAIDLRAMSENFDHGIIPLKDIEQGIEIMTGPLEPRQSVDPYKDGEIVNPPGVLASQTAFIRWDEGFLWPLFQRDVAPNHVLKIYRDFEPTAVITPCAIKFKWNEKTYYCIWDGHHTMQVCKIMGYTRFKIDYVDIDMIPQEQMIKDGFGADQRIQYAVWLAGRNMIRINSKNKRKLHPYDEFMIKLETKDKDTVSINNILVKHDCQAKRHANQPGAFTQPMSGKECYDLDRNGVKGVFFDRAVKFHRTVWPRSPLVLEIFRPMSYLYKQADLEGYTLDEGFDRDLGELLRKTYGDPDSTQESIKESYKTAVENGNGQGSMCQTDQQKVTAGLINLYEQKVNKIRLPIGQYRWTV